MKKTDIAMIILIASLSVMVSFMIANSLPFLKVDKDNTTIYTVDEVTSDVSEPDPAVFNDDAINPTIRSVIGGE